MLAFRYGVVGSSKSSNLLMQNHDYKSKGKNVLLLKSSIDTRDVGVIRSRVGIEAPCITFDKEEDLKELILDIHNKECIDVILIDEAQFLTSSQVSQLAILSIQFAIVCYGLKNTYTADLFEGSEKLLVYAEDIMEIPSVCRWCGEKATQSLRVVDNNAVYHGDLIAIGDIKECEEYYVPCCTNHYFNPCI